MLEDYNNKLHIIKKIPDIKRSAICLQICQLFVYIIGPCLQVVWTMSILRVTILASFSQFLVTMATGEAICLQICQLFVYIIGPRLQVAYDVDRSGCDDYVCSDGDDSRL